MKDSPIFLNFCFTGLLIAIMAITLLGTTTPLMAQVNNEGTDSNQTLIREESNPDILIKRRVIILNFVNLSENEDYDYLSTAMPDSILTALVRTDNFILMHRDDAWVVMDDYGIDTRDLLSEDNALFICEKVDADIVVMGSFTIEDNTLWVNSKALGLRSGQIRAIYEGTANFSGAEIFDAIDNVSSQLAANMAENIPPEPQIVRYVETERVVVEEKIVEKEVERLVLVQPDSQTSFGAFYDWSAQLAFLNDLYYWEYTVQEPASPGVDPYILADDGSFAPIDGPLFLNQHQLGLFWKFLMFEMDYSYFFIQDPTIVGVTEFKPNNTVIDAFAPPDDSEFSPSEILASYMNFKFGYRLFGPKAMDYSLIYLGFRIFRVKFTGEYSGNYYLNRGFLLGYERMDAFPFGDIVSLLLKLDVAGGLYLINERVKNGTQLESSRKLDSGSPVSDIGTVAKAKFGVGVGFPEYGMYLIASVFAQIDFYWFEFQPEIPLSIESRPDPIFLTNAGLEIAIGFYWDSEVFAGGLGIYDMEYERLEEDIEIPEEDVPTEEDIELEHQGEVEPSTEN